MFGIDNVVIIRALEKTGILTGNLLCLRYKCYSKNELLNKFSNEYLPIINVFADNTGISVEEIIDLIDSQWNKNSNFKIINEHLQDSYVDCSITLNNIEFKFDWGL